MKKWNFYKVLCPLIILAILLVTTVNVAVGQNSTDITPEKDVTTSFTRLTHTAILKNDAVAIETLTKAGYSSQQIRDLQRAILNQGITPAPTAIFTSDAYPSGCGTGYTGVAHFDIWAAVYVEMSWHFLGTGTVTRMDTCPDTIGCHYVHSHSSPLGTPFRHHVWSYSVIWPHWASCNL